MNLRILWKSQKVKNKICTIILVFNIDEQDIMGGRTRYYVNTIMVMRKKGNMVLVARATADNKNNLVKLV